MGESNPRPQFGKLTLYHLTNPAFARYSGLRRAMPAEDHDDELQTAILYHKHFNRLLIPPNTLDMIHTASYRFGKQLKPFWSEGLKGSIENHPSA